MINAIDFFHQMGLCHRDLKIENILVDDQFNLRFIDFGMTKSLADLLDEKKHNPQQGTNYYMAPEIQ